MHIFAERKGPIRAMSKGDSSLKFRLLTSAPALMSVSALSISSCIIARNSGVLPSESCSSACLCSSPFSLARARAAARKLASQTVMTLPVISRTPASRPPRPSHPLLPNPPSSSWQTAGMQAVLITVLSRSCCLCSLSEPLLARLRVSGYVRTYETRAFRVTKRQ